MNRKLLILLLVGVIVIAGIGFVSYKYIYQNNQSSLDFINKSNNTNTDTESDNNLNNDSSTVNDINPSNNTNNTGSSSDIGVEIKQDSGLFICSDKCGDGICQDKSSCSEGSLNCICPEVPMECPQDCKK